ncbi:MAG: phosphoglycerate kinase [Candidatus Bathyarchaeota archaeon]|nr:phosphoglycerate kinase [Candidatus Bathyarchaeota archaeon]
MTTDGFMYLDDFDVKGLSVFVRVDFNSPINPSTGEILDDLRIKASIPTLEALKEAKVVVGSHQGRPLHDDFTTLERHAEILGKYLGERVNFVEDVIGPKALEEIKKLKAGEVLVLDNLRLCAEENVEAPAQKLASTIFVKRLKPLFNLYVNDAFSVSHRSQASVVGLPLVLPGVAGKVLEKEIKASEFILGSKKKPQIYVLGGVKVEDKFGVIEYGLKSGKGDLFLVGGVLAEIFLKAKGYNLGVENEKKLEKFSTYVEKAKEYIKKYGEKIVLPSDLALKVGGKRVEKDVKNLPSSGVIMDLGSETVKNYTNILKDAEVIIATGPLGVFEEKGFEEGTLRILEAMGKSKAYTVIGGGHLGVLAEMFGVKDKINHISTAGGAMLAYIQGKTLPGIEALKESAKKFKEAVKHKNTAKT